MYERALVQTIVDEERHILGHKLSNLLTPVIGMAHVLSKNAAKSGDRDVQRLADTIHEAAEAASRLLAMFVQVRDIEAGARVPRMRVADLHLLLESVVGDVTRYLETDAARVEVVAVRPCRIMMDCDLVPSVFRHLLSGALSHVADEPDVAQRVVAVALERTGGEAVVRIRYGSAPLGAVWAEHFFDPFGATPVGGKGRTGLEYAYARAVVEAHGGHISVETPESGGGMVTVALPDGNLPESESAERRTEAESSLER